MLFSFAKQIFVLMSIRVIDEFLVKLNCFLFVVDHHI